MIRFEKVSKEYIDGTKALDRVDLEIEDGEFLFIVGPSGAGKSTLIKMLIREEEPSEGTISFGDVVVTDLPRKELPALRQRIGIVFQEFKLLPTKTALENVALALSVVGTPREDVEKQARKVLEKVGLGGKEEHFPRQLSGGEKQKLAIARAISIGPEALLADEPTGMIDPASTWEVIDLLQKINQDGTTVVVCTHDTDIVDTLKKRVVAMEKGRIVRIEKKGKYHE